MRNEKTRVSLKDIVLMKLVGKEGEAESREGLLAFHFKKLLDWRLEWGVQKSQGVGGGGKGLRGAPPGKMW